MPAILLIILLPLIFLFKLWAMFVVDVTPLKCLCLHMPVNRVLFLWLVLTCFLVLATSFERRVVMANSCNSWDTFVVILSNRLSLRS